MLTSTVEVLEFCEREKYAVENVWGFQFSYFYKLSHAQNQGWGQVHWYLYLSTISTGILEYLYLLK